MVHISLNQVGVEFFLFSGRHQSIRSRFIATSTGGRIARDSSGKTTVRALEEVSFEIREGERVGILGRNGAGKSTLLRVLSKVYTPTSGQAEVSGRVSSLLDLSLGINVEASGRQNIFLRAGMLGISRRDVRKSFEAIVDFSGLGEFIEAPVRTYSSGMQLRLAFAVSTIFSPEILIMDEWLAVGDNEFRTKAEARLHEIVNSSSIMVFASHSRELLERTCSRGIILEKGRVAFDGPILGATENYFGQRHSPN